MSQDERQCAKPGCKELGIHLCAACGEEIYCSKACQKEHWVDHKQMCQSALRPRATVGLTQSFDELSVKQLKNLLKTKIASFEPSKKEKILNQLDQIIEKPALVKFVAKYVKVSEVDNLLPESITPVPTEKKETKPVKKTSNSSTTTSSNNRQPTPYNNFNPNQPTPSPEQLLQQAAMMKKNPDMVRRSNPALANFTNQQIEDYAKQLEIAATDPQMMREIEKMSRMTPSDRDRIQSLQEGLSGVRDMDAKWIDYNIETLKNHTEIIKALFRGKGAQLGGVTDDQMEAFIDGTKSISAYYLKFAVGLIIYLGKLSKPAIAWWKYMDKVTLGLATYVAAALVLTMLYFMFSFWWMIIRWFYVLISPGVVKLISLATGSTIATTATNVASNTATAVDVGTSSSNGIISDLAKKGITRTLVSKVFSAVGGVFGMKAVSETPILPSSVNSFGNNANNAANNKKAAIDEEF